MDEDLVGGKEAASGECWRSQRGPAEGGSEGALCCAWRRGAWLCNHAAGSGVTLALLSTVQK